jgi:hypothetical protein
MHLWSNAILRVTRSRQIPHKYKILTGDNQEGWREYPDALGGDQIHDNPAKIEGFQRG